MSSIYDINGNPIVEGENLENLIPDRLLIWHDEFNTPNIDTSKWTPQYGRYWTGMNWGSPDLMRNAASGNGMSYFTLKDYPKEDINFSTLLMHTAGKFEFRYGRLEARMRFPDKTPHHSTFWTLGTCYQLKSNGEDETTGYGGLTPPSAGEIDIAEFDNGSVGFRTHYSDAFDSSTFLTGGNVASLTDTPTDWHTYAIEWTPTKIESYVDGVLKSTFNTQNVVYSNGLNPFKTPHYIIFNSIPKLSTDTAEILWDWAKTDVKWVRVYAPENVLEYIKETALTIPETISLNVYEKKYLNPVFTPANPSDATIRWYSYDNTIVTCDGGILTGRSAGSTIIKGYTNHDCVAFCRVTVS